MYIIIMCLIIINIQHCVVFLLRCNNATDYLKYYPICCELFEIHRNIKRNIRECLRDSKFRKK